MKTRYILLSLALSFIFIALSCTGVPQKPPMTLVDGQNPHLSNNTDNVTGKLATGEIAPDFTLPDISGKEITLSDFRGKKVMINLWWLKCHGCLEELPLLQQFYEKYAGNVALLAINSYDRPEAIKAYIEGKSYTFAVMVDEQKKLSPVYTNWGVPTTFFIDKNGVVKARKDAGFENLQEIESMFNSY